MTTLSPFFCIFIPEYEFFTMESNMNSFYLKKWYFDLLTADGNALYLYFIATKVAGIHRGSVSAHLALADGSNIRASRWTKLTHLESEEGVAIEGNRLTQQNGNSHVNVQLENISMDLRYSSVGSKWIPTDNAILLRKNGHYLWWGVPQPRASVAGTICMGSRKMEVHGLGYQDIVEITIPPWRLPITQLLWGRAHCGNYTVVYDQLKTKNGGCFRHLLLQHGNVDLVKEDTFAIHADEKDNETKLVHKTFTLSLKCRRILEESPIATDERIRSKFLRNLLAHTSGYPEELKMVSDAVLCIGETVLPGMALHERVVWHWKGVTKHEC
jgi:hypothetical protein